MEWVAYVLDHLRWLDDPWVHWPLAGALALVILLRLFRRRVAIGWHRLRDWVKRRYVWAFIFGAIVFAGPFWWLYLTELRDFITKMFDLVDGTNDPDDLRSLAYALGAMLTAIAILAAAPFQLIKTWLNERQTITAETVMFTTRFTQAVEQLGAEKSVKRREFRQRFKTDENDSWLRDEHDDPVPATRPDGTLLGSWDTYEETLPNLEVRLGAIYALERIAQDSERDHITVMETLCAYIRENAPAREAKDHALGDWPDWIDNATEEQREERAARIRDRIGPIPVFQEGQLHVWARGLDAPRVDIQAALTVIGRRSEERIAHERRQTHGGEDEPGFCLDLRATNLRRADLTRTDLRNALLIGARMEGANLGEARLERANLWQTRLEGANLWQARLEGAYLRQTQLEGANLWQARMEGANLGEARLEGANLWQARMEGAYLGEARLEAANLVEARLKSADLRDWTIARMSLRSANLTQAKNLTQDAVNTAWGDSATLLPEGIVRPDHWDEDSDIDHTDEKYQAWLAAGAPPGKVPGGD